MLLLIPQETGSTELQMVECKGVDACLKQTPMPGSMLAEKMNQEGFHDHHDHFVNTTPESEYKTCLEHAEKIGLGTKSYELHYVK